MADVIEKPAVRARETQQITTHTDSREILANAKRDIERYKLKDYFIVDVDSHHVEFDSWSEVLEHIEDPVLRRNGQTLTESSVTLVNGSATVEFTDRITRGGGFEYQAEIRPEKDAHPGNNRATRWIEITGGPRIILATRYQDDPVAKALAALSMACFKAT